MINNENYDVLNDDTMSASFYDNDMHFIGLLFSDVGQRMGWQLSCWSIIYHVM